MLFLRLYLLIFLRTYIFVLKLVRECNCCWYNNICPYTFTCNVKFMCSHLIYFEFILGHCSSIRLKKYNGLFYSIIRFGIIFNKIDISDIFEFEASLNII